MAQAISKGEKSIMSYTEPLNSHILVTGGAGLIGSAILIRLNQLGYTNITVVDHLSDSEKWKNLRAAKYRRYYERDVFEKMLDTDTVPDDIKVIFHLGACSSTTETQASYLANNNYEYTIKLTDFAIANGCRMIYASSAATYGDGNQGFKDNEAEIDSLRPLNMYGYSKQMVDQYLANHGLLTAKHAGGASFVGTKYSNVFGPNEYHKANMRSMVLRAYEQITTNGSVNLFKSYRDDYADGEQVRDFIYVKDAADMTVFFMNGGRDCCGLYNIGFGMVRSWNDLAKAMFSALQVPVKINYIEMPDTLKNKYQYYTCLDISKIRRAGYDKELISLEDAVADYAEYLKADARLGDL